MGSDALGLRGVEVVKLDQYRAFEQRANNNALLVALGLMQVKADGAAQFFKAAVATVQALHFVAVNVENGFIERARAYGCKGQSMARALPVAVSPALSLP